MSDDPFARTCDHDCEDGCSMTEFPVWMRPYRCRHLSDTERRIRGIVFAEHEGPTVSSERAPLIYRGIHRCGAIRSNGERCLRRTAPGSRCIHHEDRTDGDVPTYIPGDAREATEHEGPSTTDARGPAVPQTTDVQAEPAEGAPTTFRVKFPENANYGCVDCGSINHTTGDTTWCQAAKLDCALCDEPVDADPGDVRFAHRGCMLRSVLGGIGHILDHAHWCTERHDPDAGLDYRTSALLVEALVDHRGVDWIVERDGLTKPG